MSPGTGASESRGGGGGQQQRGCILMMRGGVDGADAPAGRGLDERCESRKQRRRVRPLLPSLSSSFSRPADASDGTGSSSAAPHRPRVEARAPSLQQRIARGRRPYSQRRFFTAQGCCCSGHHGCCRGPAWLRRSSPRIARLNSTPTPRGARAAPRTSMQLSPRSAQAHRLGLLGVDSSSRPRGGGEQGLVYGGPCADFDLRGVLHGPRK